MENSVQPHDLDLESSVLATCFIAGEDALSEVIDLIEPEYFYKTANKLIFKAILELSFKVESVDLVTVTELLRSQDNIESVGITYISQIVDSPIAVDIQYSCKKIEEKFLLRKAIERCYATIKKCHNVQDDFDHVIDYFVGSANEVSEGSKACDPVKDMKSIAMEATEVYDRRYSEENIITGVATGIHDLDMMTYGLHEGDLTLLAGRPGMGKTAAAVNIAKNAAERGDGCLFVSLEMPMQQLFDRLVAIETGIDGGNIRIGNFTKVEFDRVQSAIAKLYELPIYIDDRGGLEWSEVRKTIRRQVKAHPEIKLIIIDHLQLVRGRNQQNRNLEIGEISSGLKALAKQLRLPVIALSQLNRELERRSNPYRRPKQSDLRDSGSLEQDADNIIFIYRPWVYGDNISPQDGKTEVEITENDCELILAKQRQGSVGVVDCKFYADCQKIKGVTIESPNTLYKKRRSEKNE